MLSSLLLLRRQLSCPHFATTSSTRQSAMSAFHDHVPISSRDSAPASPLGHLTAQAGRPPWPPVLSLWPSPDAASPLSEMVHYGLDDPSPDASQGAWLTDIGSGTRWVSVSLHTIRSSWAGCSHGILSIQGLVSYSDREFAELWAGALNAHDDHASPGPVRKPAIDAHQLAASSA